MSDIEQANQKDSIPFYPDHVSTEAKVTVGILGIVVIFGILGLLYPLGLGDPADPLNTPAHVKPEWYFLALYQLLKYIPKTVGAVMPVIAIALITIWPFIDRKKDVSRKVIYYRFILVVVALIVIIAMTVWGEVS